MSLPSLSWMVQSVRVLANQLGVRSTLTTTPLKGRQAEGSRERQAADITMTPPPLHVTSAAASSSSSSSSSSSASPVHVGGGLIKVSTRQKRPHEEVKEPNYKTLYKAPTPRQEYVNGIFTKNQSGHEEAQSDESWVELFIDLVYVSMLLKLGSMLVSCFDLKFIVGRVFVLFANLVLTRYAIDEYANRFFSHDLVHKILYYFYIIGVFVQVLNINSSYNASLKCTYVPIMSLGIISGIIVTKICIIIIHLMVIYHNHAAKLQFRWDIIRWTISLLIMIINLVLHFNGYQEEWLDFLLILILIFQEFIIWIISRTLYRKYYTYPVDLQGYQSRWGMWIMIVIGESVIQLLVAELDTDHVMQDYLYSVICLTTMFSLGMQYYDSCHRDWYEHAMTQSATAGIIWIWLQPCLSFFLFGVGVAFKMSSYSSYKVHYDIIFNSSRLLSLGMGLATLCFSGIRFAHEGFQIKNEDYFALFFSRVVLSVVQMTVYLWPVVAESRLYCAAFHLLINTVGFNFIDIYFEVHCRTTESDKHENSLDDPRRASRAWNSLGLVSREKEGFLKLLLCKIFPCLKRRNVKKADVSPMMADPASNLDECGKEKGAGDDHQYYGGAKGEIDVENRGSSNSSFSRVKEISDESANFDNLIPILTTANNTSNSVINTKSKQEAKEDVEILEDA